METLKAIGGIGLALFLWLRFLMWATDSEEKIRRLHKERMLQLELDREYEEERKLLK